MSPRKLPMSGHSGRYSEVAVAVNARRPACRRRAPRVVAAATPLRVGSAWTPYVGFGVDGAAICSLPMNGPAIVCSPVGPR